MLSGVEIARCSHSRGPLQPELLKMHRRLHSWLKMEATLGWSLAA